MINSPYATSFTRTGVIDMKDHRSKSTGIKPAGYKAQHTTHPDLARRLRDFDVTQASLKSDQKLGYRRPGSNKPGKASKGRGH